MKDDFTKAGDTKQESEKNNMETSWGRKKKNLNAVGDDKAWVDDLRRRLSVFVVVAH